MRISPFLVLGHRGAAGHAPENTFASLEKAVALGAPWVEVDVRLTRDGVPVLLHDETLERTRGVPARLSERTLREWRNALDGSEAPIPSVSEVLDLLRGRVGLNLEIKERDVVDALAKPLGAALQSGWAPEELLLSSFDPETLRRAGELLPSLPRGYLAAQAPPTLVAEASTSGARVLGLSHAVFSREIAREAHGQGLEVWVFTVNEPDEILRLAEGGADGAFTDYPERALVVLRREGIPLRGEPRVAP